MLKCEKIEWICSDLHYNHKKMITEYGRPSDYEELMDTSWLTQVKPIDTIFCLGDINMKDDQGTHEKFIKTKPGYKILIRGNHDKKPIEWYLKNGWDEVYDSHIINRTIKNKYTRIMLTHKPIRIDYDKFDMNAFGHLHNDQHRLTPEIRSFLSENHKLFAMELTNYKILPLIEFLER